MEMWGGKCGILESGLSTCAAKMRRSAKAAPAAQKDVQQGKPGAFLPDLKMQAAFLPSSLHRAF